MVCTGNGLVLFIFSKEGVTQGDPLSMVYPTALWLLLPLICSLKEEIPDIDQPWYADDDGAGGTFKGIRRYFESLQVKGPKHGYLLDPSESILIVQPHNVAAAEKSSSTSTLQS